MQFVEPCEPWKAFAAAQQVRKPRPSFGRAVLIGLAVVLAGTVPRNIFFSLNLRYFANFPWAAPVTGAYLWFFWRYLKSSDERRQLPRANPLPLHVWLWAVISPWAR